MKIFELINQLTKIENAYGKDVKVFIQRKNQFGNVIEVNLTDIVVEGAVKEEVLDRDIDNLKFSGEVIEEEKILFRKLRDRRIILK